MNPIEPLAPFNLLNVEGKRLVISNMRNLLDIVISILYFGNPSKVYMKGLLDVASDLLECMFLNDSSLFPQIKRSNDLTNILARFNKLQVSEEAQVINNLNRFNSIIPADTPITAPSK